MSYKNIHLHSHTHTLMSHMHARTHTHTSAFLSNGSVWFTLGGSIWTCLHSTWCNPLTKQAISVWHQPLISRVLESREEVQKTRTTISQYSQKAVNKGIDGLQQGLGVGPVYRHDRNPNTARAKSTNLRKKRPQIYIREHLIKWNQFK